MEPQRGREKNLVHLGLVALGCWAGGALGATVMRVALRGEAGPIAIV